MIALLGSRPQARRQRGLLQFVNNLDPAVGHAYPRNYRCKGMHLMGWL